MAFMRILLVVCLAFMLPGCSGSVDQGDAGDGADGQDANGGDGGDGGPVLSDGIVSSCFDWPAEEFTADNHAQIQTIAEGSLAVEFILEDVDGTAYTLSDMLLEKPVLMVFGSYT